VVQRSVSLHVEEALNALLDESSVAGQLTDNGSIFAANRTLEIAAVMNLEPCFTPVESPESMADAFVKTFKRDYIRINRSIRSPTPEPRSHGAIIGSRITTLNTRIHRCAIAHRESRLHHFTGSPFRPLRRNRPPRRYRRR